MLSFMTHTETQSNRTKGEGSIYADTKTGIWMYSIMHEGKRLTKSLSTRDEKEARRKYIGVAREFGGQIERGELEPTSVKNFTIGELLSRYITYMDDNGRKSAEMVRLTVGVIERDATFLPGRKAALLTTTDFETYRKRHAAKGVSQRTINYRFALIRAAFNLETKRTPSCVAKDKVPYIPFVSVDNVREGFLEYDDHFALLAELPPSLKALFVIAFHSGCRLGEVLNMRWADVDFKNRIIRLPKTKNGKKRNLPFWGSIEAHLKAQKERRDAHHEACEHVFFWMVEDCILSPKNGGVRVAPGAPIQDFRATWANAVKRAHKTNANVKEGLLFHDLRRSGVRVMIQDAGIPEAQAMLISGHETRTMLERYNIVSLKNVQDAGAKLDAWSRTREQTSKPTELANG
jgi:integrase